MFKVRLEGGKTIVVRGGTDTLSVGGGVAQRVLRESFVRPDLVRYI